MSEVEDINYRRLIKWKCLASTYILLLQKRRSYTTPYYKLADNIKKDIEEGE